MQVTKETLFAVEERDNILNRGGGTYEKTVVPVLMQEDHASLEGCDDFLLWGLAVVRVKYRLASHAAFSGGS